jgi:uncharacterized protein (DUF2342 family)
MLRTILGAVAAVLILSPGVSAQQPADSSQSMMQQQMQQMQERMQSMQERMQSMHQMMQRMHGAQGGAQSMQAMGTQARGQTQNCIAGSPEGGLSALLMGAVRDLALTDAQRTRLEEILERAQGEALGALTPEQREQLESAPSPARPMCPPAQPN